MQNTTYFLENEQDSRELAVKLARAIKPNDILAFNGDLGAGKTFLCREIIKNLCGPNTNIISPTFNLLQTYEYKDIQIYHFDLFPKNEYSMGLTLFAIQQSQEINTCWKIFGLNFPIGLRRQRQLLLVNHSSVQIMQLYRCFVF